MTTPAIADYLKYADLQMAAEAFIRDPDTGVLNASGDDLKGALTTGNKHTSVFTAIQAAEFAAQWEVLDQRINTTTGFSGTLFKATKDNAALGIHKDDLVMSFRSTEFIDDAVRDNAATNTLEIKNTGWAWGQIADMEQWYAELNAAGGPLNGKTYAVTGYSLGGHLATAFNLLRREDLIKGKGPGSNKLFEPGPFDPNKLSNAKTGMAAAYASGDYTMQEIAEFFDVHYATVSRAVKHQERKV